MQRMTKQRMAIFECLSESGIPLYIEEIRAQALTLPLKCPNLIRKSCYPTSKRKTA